MRKYILGSVVLCLIVLMGISCQNQETIDLQNYMSNGRDIYQSKCQNCHGEKGEGLGELAPPLTDSVFLRTNKAKLSCIIKNGLSELITVHGKSYHEKMPAFPELADIDVAQVMVYVTNSFGNHQGFYDYKKVSQDLQSCK